MTRVPRGERKLCTGVLRGLLVAVAAFTLTHVAFAANPQITTVRPTAVFQNGPAFNVTLFGASFTDGGAPTLRFTPPGGIPTVLMISTASATSITAAVPASLLASSGTGALEVQSGALTSSSFSYAILTDPVVVTGISPTSAVTGGLGFTLTVNGSGFVAPTLGPDPSPGTVVRFGAPGPVLPTTFVNPTKITALVPGSDTPLTRADFERLTVLAQFTEQGITAYLNGTGGIFCSFADVPCPSGTVVTDTTGAATGWRYIESSWRLGYSTACSGPGELLRRFCPTLSANLLGTPGTSGVVAINMVAILPSERDSSPVSFLVVPPTPTPTPTSTPTNTPTNTPTTTPTNAPTSTPTPDPRIAAIPTLSPGMLGLLVGGLAALALMLLRRS